MKFVEYDYKGFLEILGSKEPAPGGGSVGAISGGLSVALLEMICKISQERSSDIQDIELYNRVLKGCKKYRDFFIDSVDEDSKSFIPVLEAYKLDRSTLENERERTRRIEEAYKGACDLPHLVLKRSNEFIDLLEAVLPRIKKAIVADLYASAIQIEAAIQGAIVNLKINSKYVKDETFKNEISKDIDFYNKNSSKRITEIKTYINKRMQNEI